MKASNSNRGLVLVLLCSLAMAAGFATQVAAQKTEAKKNNSARLPAHYAKVVDDEQRSEIYAIQEQFEPKLAKVRAELKALVAERDAAIDKVLSAQQRKEVEKLRAEAAERRRAALSKAEPVEEAPATEKAKSKSKKAA